ncbi:MAG: hypothetical protein JNM56_17140 [Planctomycetia bacterium]|nr:hypothetical protein [Planctomycetia bacterium]
MAWTLFAQGEAVAPIPAESALNTAAVAALANAERVEAFRVDPLSHDATTTDGRIEGYRITATAPAQGRTFAARLGQVLQDERTYYTGPAKGCKFSPGVVFRAWSGGSAVSVVLCFECDQLRATTRDEQGWVVHEARADCDPGRAALVRLAKEVFTEDAEIQDLVESR